MIKATIKFDHRFVDSQYEKMSEALINISSVHSYDFRRDNNMLWIENAKDDCYEVISYFTEKELSYLKKYFNCEEIK
ncbi:hypothetical protein [Bacillus sp. NPDC094106]|uniref:hypothetical protein n=1 Tax=Bacillus sp. NPDC094106 TaxID=3363949 RepID=UPI0038169E7B